MATLYKVSFSGTLSGGAEEFVHSMFVASVLADATDQGFVASEMSGAITAMLATAISGASPAANLGALFTSQVHWTLCEARAWNPATNKQIGAPASVPIDETGTAADAFGLPNQCAFAVSLRKGTTGRSRWNRQYMPPMSTIASGGTDFVPLSVADAFSDWIIGLQLQLNALTPALTIVRYSPKLGTFATPDATFVGTRLDTIRRRANGLPEARSETPFP